VRCWCAGLIDWNSELRVQTGAGRKAAALSRMLKPELPSVEDLVVPMLMSSDGANIVDVGTKTAHV
jgi:hypothetical protein